ncbi:MAG: ATP-binding protein, partial [Bacteroidota bacterium]
FLFRNIIQRRKYHMTLELRVKKRTEKLKELNEDLEQANFELKRFNRIVSHDLRAPLQNIQALSELVKEEVGEYGENSLHLALIGRSSKQISRLLEDLTHFFSYEQHQLKLEGFKLEELLGEVKLALKTQIEDKQVEMTATELPFIYSYWTPLFLTLKNLIENAIKYNESELPRLLISYKRVKQFHIIEVKDNGIGIAADHHEKVFEIFQRVFPQNKYDGSGLGLSISRKMIRAIGGEVLLQSSMVDKGSIFEIRLPVEEKLENVLEEKRSELG